MPLVLLLTALVTGLGTATYWGATGGSLMGSFMAYVFAGNLAMIAVLGHSILRQHR